MKLRFPIICVALLCVAPAVLSQQIEVNRQNRTVSVTVKESISVEAEVADITIGCLTYAETHNQAYAENLQKADKILKAILAFGVTKEDITTARVELSEISSEDEDSRTAKTPKPRRFKVHQGWTVRVAAGDAQKVIDIAVQAGANGIEGVTWAVKDPGALEARARAAALVKAKAVAAELANDVGAKLGNALYVSNYITEITYVSKRSSGKRETTDQNGVFETPDFKLELFPEKVSEEATVDVTFALE
jgi:uncharacterized protein YggE